MTELLKSVKMVCVETAIGSEREKSNLDFTESVTKIIDSVERLNTPDKNHSEYTILDISENEQLVIRMRNINKQEGGLYKYYQKLNLKPQKVEEIQIWYGHLQLESGEPVNLTLNFKQEEWKDRVRTSLIKASTLPWRVMDNPPRLKHLPQGIYPIYDRDTIDWSKMPPRTPVSEGKAIELLEKMQEKLSAMSPNSE